MTTKQVSFTPGEWKVLVESQTVYDRHTGEPVDERTVWVQDANANNVALIINFRTPYEANAALIASAPELAEACASALADMERWSRMDGTPGPLSDTPTMAKLRAALRKAGWE